LWHVPFTSAGFDAGGIGLIRLLHVNGFFINQMSALNSELPPKASILQFVDETPASPAIISARLRSKSSLEFD
jgi:hypothetical protein